MAGSSFLGVEPFSGDPAQYQPETLTRSLTNDPFAEELEISKNTVANHVATILRKLNLPSRSRTASWVTERKMLDPQ